MEEEQNKSDNSKQNLNTIYTVKNDTFNLHSADNTCNLVLSAEEILMKDIECNQNYNSKEEKVDFMQDCEIIDFEVNVAEFRYEGRKVTEYEPINQNFKNKLPYLAVSCIFNKNFKTNIFALFDSGCSSSLVNHEFINKFPKDLQKHIEPLDIPLGVATTKATARIIGKVKLMICLKDSQFDRNPMIFVQEFFIATFLGKDMYIGADFIMNENVLIKMTTKGFFMKRPKDYIFETSNYEEEDGKFIPFFMLSSTQATATNYQSFISKSNEIMEVKCSLNKDLRGKCVTIRNYPDLVISTHSANFGPIQPKVREMKTLVDENNCVNIFVLNNGNFDYSVQNNSILAVVEIETDIVDFGNFAFNFPELNEIEVFGKDDIKTVGSEINLYDFPILNPILEINFVYINLVAFHFNKIIKCPDMTCQFRNMNILNRCKKRIINSLISQTRNDKFKFRNFSTLLFDIINGKRKFNDEKNNLHKLRNE